MAIKKQALGKGLGALLANNISNDNKSVLDVSISDVKPGKDQPRKTFDKEKLEALAASIKEHGIIQPLIVNRENDIYYIIAGERRWRAAKLAGFKKVPVIEKTATSKEIMEELSYNYGTNVDNTKVIINPHFCIVYEETQNETELNIFQSLSCYAINVT